MECFAMTSAGGEGTGEGREVMSKVGALRRLLPSRQAAASIHKTGWTMVAVESVSFRDGQCRNPIGESKGVRIFTPRLRVQSKRCSPSWEIIRTDGERYNLAG